jgi:Zn ribbon nucleic-acid-binding protein
MQPFVCPQCGHRSSFDPWAGAARCPRCGFVPGTGANYVSWAQRQAHQPFLDELQAHWNGSHRPDPSFTLPTPDDALAFFQEYQRALGEDPRAAPGPHVEYVREYQPTRQEILIFAGAYLWLRRGRRDRAAEDLVALAFTAPKFVDAWVWRSATTDDVEQRLEYLDQATRLDLGHPLARDALALARGDVPLAGERRRRALVTAQCPQCGAGLRYEPGAGQVECAHCGHAVGLEATDVVDQRARAVHNLRLERRYQGHTWEEASRVVHCCTCGADLTMTQHLAQRCAFCESTNVLTEERDRLLEQPDGLLPFQIGKAQALAAIEQAQSRLSRRFISWLSGSRMALREIHGLYLPFWVFDGMVEAYHFLKGWTTTSKESLGLTSHENLLFPGVDVPAPSLLQRIYPFGLEALVPYEPRLLADWPARLYSQDVEMAAETARAAMINLAREQSSTTARPLSPGSQARLGRRITTLDAATAQQVFYQVVGTAYQLLLLPVWLAHLEGDGQRSLGLVNGQTGKAALGTGGPEG